MAHREGKETSAVVLSRGCRDGTRLSLEERDKSGGHWTPAGRWNSQMHIRTAIKYQNREVLQALPSGVFKPQP